MAQPSPKLIELARRILEHESGAPPDRSAPAVALEGACRRLRGHLTDLLGSVGVSALLGRALHLAQREEPLLAGVAVSGEPAACFVGLPESLAANTEEEAAAATATVLTHMLDLLVVLLGEELGMKPVRKLWPEATGVRESENESGES